MPKNPIDKNGIMGFQTKETYRSSSPATTLRKQVKREPLYDARKAREPLSDKTFKLIYEMVPQDEFISDGNFDQWLDNDD